MGTATATLIPVEEYLRSTYVPDVDYIDGQLKERNVGERPHAQVQIILGAVFRNNRKEWKVVAMGDQRVQVNSTRYRIPDLCVIRNTDPNEDIVSVAPLLCVEILSKGDTLNDLQERVDDYLDMGVENIWVIDPWNRTGYVASRRGFLSPIHNIFNIDNTPIVIGMKEIFAELDES